MNKNFASIILFISAICVFQAHEVSAMSLFACTNLTYSLATGSNDAKTNGEVTKLQAFLKGAGYLSATINGNFGPATLAAVKSFQTANNISPTGTVGPLTRVAVQVKSCAEVQMPPIPTTTTTNTTTNNTPTVIGVSTPAAGQRFSIGQALTIVWNKSGFNQSVILEDDMGVAQGFITSDRGGTTNYSWKVGYIYSSKTQSDTIAPPGSYRIRISGSGADQISGLFTIDAPEMIVKSFTPSQIIANNTSSIVIYGTGFTSKTVIYIDDRYGSIATRLYTSPDGKVLVFAIPPTITVGTHWIILDDNYGTTINAGQVTITSTGIAY